MYQAQDVLDFWFGELDADGNPTPACSDLWWKGQPETDALIKERFEPLVWEVADGQHPDWMETARGRLALIITLDQFPRNIYRGTPQAFAYDTQAQQLSLEGIERGQDRELPPVQRVFFYMPLEHAEDKGLQAESVRLFAALREEAPDHLYQMCDGYLDYAERHKNIVDRFGHFPHRNKILGRTSLAEEIAFLKQPRSSF